MDRDKVEAAIGRVRAAIDSVGHQHGSMWFNADTDHGVSLEDLRLLLARTETPAGEVERRIYVLGRIASEYEHDANLNAFDRALDKAYDAGRRAALAQLSAPEVCVSDELRARLDPVDGIEPVGKPRVLKSRAQPVQESKA